MMDGTGSDAWICLDIPFLNYAFEKSNAEDKYGHIFWDIMMGTDSCYGLLRSLFTVALQLRVHMNMIIPPLLLCLLWLIWNVSRVSGRQRY